MAGLLAAPSSTPMVEMAGFANRKYDTLFFTIDRRLARSSSPRPSPISQAVNRCLHTYFEDIGYAPLNRFLPVPGSRLAFLNVAFSGLNFDYCWLVLTDPPRIAPP
jgi:hypothetical protein